MDELARTLSRLDGRGYKAYKELAGRYEFPEWTLHIDHVQGDPFAAPSKLRLRVPQRVSGLPPALFETRTRRLALQDFLARAVRGAIPQRTSRGIGKSGLITIDAGGQEVLERTALVVDEEKVEARIELGLPAAGRRILGTDATSMLLRDLPAIVERALVWKSVDQEAARSFVDVVETYHAIRDGLSGRGLVAFIEDGARLPRASGASDRPMKDPVTFQAPDALRVSLPLGEGRTAVGMGIPEGVTLIVGGGYHGKTTLLKAIERGVYPHIPGDGRERVVTRADAVKIRAEDGRRVERVDISPFIQHLPQARRTDDFSSDDASGSTSQAANIMEALEVGARVLLLDEDTSATNFMVRDARMQALVSPAEEPILPFVDRVKELHERLSVSTILVMGGSGDYFEPADNIIKMSEYVPELVTDAAKNIASRRPTGRSLESNRPIALGAGRRLVASSVDASRGRRPVKIDAAARDQLTFGAEIVDLRAVEQLVERSQTRAVGFACHLAATTLASDVSSLDDMMQALEAMFDEEGLDVLALYGRPGEHPGNFARPRRFEIAAALNRMRSVAMERLK